MKNKLVLSTLIIILVYSFSYLMLPTKILRTKVLGTDVDESVFDTDASYSEHNVNTTTLFPIDDTTVESRYEDAKLGIWGSLSLDYSQGTGHDWSSFIIIKFDLSSIPVNAEIESA